jgi:environmental stress-induced protein Ves
MRKLDPSTFKTTPWKNGGGSTREALVIPVGASHDTFELRVSLAKVEADGPFSEFPGIDRTLVVTEGAGMELQTFDDSTVTLTRQSRPFAFTGDDPVTAKLVAGAISDLNIMTRRGVLNHRAARIPLTSEGTVACTGELTLLVVLDGEATAVEGNHSMALFAGDIVVIAKGDEQVVLRPAREGVATDLLCVDVTRR